MDYFQCSVEKYISPEVLDCRCS